MKEIHNMAELAEIVRQVRKSQKVSQTVLSQVSNVGIRFLGDIERGKPSVHFDKLMQVLTSLGVAVKIELPPE